MYRSEGLISIHSTLSVDEVVDRISSLLKQKGVKLFAIVDHSGEAATAGIKMPNTKLLIFGNPKAGTPLMLSRPSVAIDLPLKILVAESGQSGSTITYNDPAYIQRRHGIPDELLANIAAIATFANAASAAA